MPQVSIRQTIRRAAALPARACIGGLLITLALAGLPSSAFGQSSLGAYRLPWTAGESYVVSQGWGGNGLPARSRTHNAQPEYYGYDFKIREGIVLRAANEGKVIFARGDVNPNFWCDNWGCANTNNHVTILHPDNTETVYVHLSRVVVKAGDTVKRGQIIGYSGKTGFTSGYEHLHFQHTVHSTSTWYPTSIPIDFEEGGKGELVAGRAYKSTNDPAAAPKPVAPETRSLSTVGGSGYWLDGFGDLHVVGNAPAVPNDAGAGHHWPGWNIARSVAVRPDGKSGYILDGWGLLHPFGGAPALDAHGVSWPNWDIARSLVLASDGNSGYILDGYGAPHRLGSAPAATGYAYWPGWDIARGIALRSDNRSGYTLDGFGGVHPFGGAPKVSTTAYWPNWDIARAIALIKGGTSGYVLDGYGALHAFGGAPAVKVSRYTPGVDDARGVSLSDDGRGGWVLFSDGKVAPFGDTTGLAPGPGRSLALNSQGSGYWLDGFGNLRTVGSSPPVPNTAAAGHSWQGWDIARAAALRPDGTSGYVLDGYGALHPFGGAPGLDAHGLYWGGWDIARAFVLASDGNSGYVLDGWGGVHRIGAAPAATGGPYWSGWDIARGLALRPDNQSGYVLDGYGGVHPFSGAPAVDQSAYWPNWDIARAIALRPDGVSGYVLDGYGAVHQFGAAPAVKVSRYTSGKDDARAITLTADGNGGWVLFKDGGVAPFGDAGATPPPAWPAEQPAGSTAEPPHTPMLTPDTPADGSSPGAPPVLSSSQLLKAALAKCKKIHKTSARQSCVRKAKKRYRPNYG
jgi:peptidase M23-like protein